MSRAPRPLLQLSDNLCQRGSISPRSKRRSITPLSSIPENHNTRGLDRLSERDELASNIDIELKDIHRRSGNIYLSEEEARGIHDHLSTSDLSRSADGQPDTDRGSKAFSDWESYRPDSARLQEDDAARDAAREQRSMRLAIERNAMAAGGLRRAENQVPYRSRITQHEVSHFSDSSSESSEDDQSKETQSEPQSGTIFGTSKRTRKRDKLRNLFKKKKGGIKDDPGQIARN